jgi:ABC-2 type transport system ATP-binding protein
MARPTSGQARVFGLDADAPEASVAIRRRTCFVSEDKDLFDSMTVEEIIRFTAAFYPRGRRDLEQRYLRRFDLPAGRKIKDLSRGAGLLILDEPTSGLDATTVEEVLQAIVAHVAGEEMTVFFSSHQIAEVDQIADRVTIVDGGQAVVDGAIEDLRETYRRIHLVFDGEAPQPAFRASGIVRVRRQGRTLTVLVSAGPERVIEEARALNPVSVEVIPVTLKEIFLETVTKED